MRNPPSPTAQLKRVKLIALLAVAAFFSPAFAQQRPTVNLTSQKIGFVTGSNRGIGLEIARAA